MCFTVFLWSFLTTAFFVLHAFIVCLVCETVPAWCKVNAGNFQNEYAWLQQRNDWMLATCSCEKGRLTAKQTKHKMVLGNDWKVHAAIPAVWPKLNFPELSEFLPFFQTSSPWKGLFGLNSLDMRQSWSCVHPQQPSVPSQFCHCVVPASLHEKLFKEEHVPLVKKAKK